MAAAPTASVIREIESARVPEPYVDLPCRMMAWWGAHFERQGDRRFVGVLRQAGCNMHDISGTAMRLAAIAPLADGPTTIRNVGHIRHKETGRLGALVIELRRVGAEARDDSLTIYPTPALRGAEIETCDDHRMAMSFAVLGLRTPGITICDPACVAKTRPDFFWRLRLLAETAGTV